MLLINVKIVCILSFIRRINDRLLLFKPKISIDSGYFDIYEQLKFYGLI